MTIQPQNSNLNYLIDPSFTNVNSLFVLSFPRNNNTDGKSFFNLPVKHEEQTYEKIIQMSNNNDYTTGNLLDFASFKKIYKFIAIGLSKQTRLKDPQQIIFIGTLLRNTGATMFFIFEKSEETTFNFSQNSATII